jgi:hypothetical protein
MHRYLQFWSIQSVKGAPVCLPVAGIVEIQLAKLVAYFTPFQTQILAMQIIFGWNLDVKISEYA